MVRRDSLNKIIGTCVAGLLLSLAAGAQVLTIAAINQNGFGGVNGIRGIRSILISEDGNFAYAAAETDASVVVFSRDPATGWLTQIQKLTNLVDGIDGLRGANTVRLSPNGKNLYATGFFGDSLAVFSRDTTTGLLTEIQVLKDNTVEVPDGLDGALWITVSDDGENVYTSSFFDDAVVVFDRDEGDGRLTFRQVLKDGVGGINGLDGAYAMFMDSKSKNLYVGGLEESTLNVFRRNSHGDLTLVQEIRNGVGGVTGLGQIRGIFGDSKGKSIYTVALADNAIATFDRNNGHGTLTQTQVITDTDPGIDGLGGATGITITRDNHYVIATGFAERKIAIFERERNGHSRGQLSFAQLLTNLIDTPFGLNGPIDLHASSDGCQVYSASYNVAIILQWDVVGCGDGGGDDD
jgi:6-phosphogluconolactonase (cycloisomerase 2 family)